MKTTKLFSMMLCASTLSLMAMGCDEQDNIGDVPEPTTPPASEVTRAVVDGSTGMGYNLFKVANRNSAPNENFVLSPLSATEVLAMLATGAEGKTQEEILSVMNIGASDCYEARKCLLTLNDYLCYNSSKCTVSIANSQWFDSGLHINDSYIKHNREELDAETFIQDLSTEKTKNDINSWCKEKTQGCINPLLKEPLSEDARIVLLNALYFKGEWKFKFDKEETYEEDFFNWDNTKTTVQMMRQTAKLPLYQGETFDVVELPYGDDRFCMNVILPHWGDSLNGCLNNLEKTKMDKIFAEMYTEEVSLFMPRMELKYRCDLKDNLFAMGMKEAFGGNPNFSGINKDHTFSLKIQQATYFKVDEEGTTAAAVTQSTLYDKGMYDFSMDRPFAFLIREKKTGTILFLGRVVKF